MQLFHSNDNNAKEQRRHTKELEALAANADVQLDGSEWARLANQRLHRDRRPQTDPNLNVMTSSLVAKNLSADHVESRCAVEHWFCPVPSTYEAVDESSVRAAELLDSKRLGEVSKEVDQS
jgi:hypothetical protein